MAPVGPAVVALLLSLVAIASADARALKATTGHPGLRGQGAAFEDDGAIQLDAWPESEFQADIDGSAASQSRALLRNKSINVFIQQDCAEEFKGFGLLYSPFTQVSTLKMQSTNFFKIPAKYQVLTYNGKVLEDKKTLQHYKIKDKSFVTLADKRLQATATCTP